MKRFITASLMLLAGIWLHAQIYRPDNLQLIRSALSDTLRKKIEAAAGALERPSGNAALRGANTLTPSDYVLSIERVNDNLNSIRDSVKLGFEVIRLKRKIDAITADVNAIRQNSRGRNTVINIKNLYLYQSFALNLDKENTRFQNGLERTYDRVYSASKKLKIAFSDSVFRILVADNSKWNTYKLKLTRVERKWLRTDSTARANIDSLNTLKVKMADNCMNLSAVLNMMDSRLDKSDKQLFAAEVNPLWKKGHTVTTSGDTSRKLISMLGSEQKAIGYYFSQTSGQRTVIFVIAILLFTWLFIKRNILKVLRQPSGPLDFLNLEYLKYYPVCSLLVMVLSMMPFFDAYAPSSYTVIEYLILLGFSTAIFLKKEDLLFKVAWVILLILFIVNALAFLLFEPTILIRLFLIAVQACIILAAILLLRSLNKADQYNKWIRKAIITGMILSGLSIIANIYGRMSLSGIFGLSAIFAITQAVVLPIFIDSIIEIILLQLQSSRLRKGFNKPFNSSVVIDKIKMPLAIIAVILWFFMLTSNLSIYHTITNGIVSLINSPRTIGSITFKLISVIWFFAIIWLAHILQQLISFLFGETGTDTDDSTPISKQQHSRLLITRLLVLIGGYMLAIAASGLPIDKLTFLLGALGVGIGMGLQNVVNNFVSGIILIFDGSLKIGDEIEVSGQAGKVKKIGLRASTLNTADGAEVIIPNGTILSQNIVNWTFSNDQKRVLIWFSLAGKELDSNEINDIINSTITNIPDVIPQKKPAILYSRVTPDSCTITVKFWCNINSADAAKSAAMLQLSSAFADKSIGFE
jgi:potassium-dependent mechanosensitive channel